jgi:DNA-binding GntR family transcriptional regulator
MPDDLPAGGPTPAEDGEGSRRGKGFKARKREDHALVLIRDLLASLDNPAQARRLLLELSRYYDPILGGGIVEVRHQREIMNAIEAGRPEEARALVQARYDLYIKDRAHLGRGEEG